MVVIKSNVGHKNCKVLICSESVSFNGEGEGEVSSQEKAEEIVEKWGDRFSLDGDTPLKEEGSDEDPDVNLGSDEDPEGSDEDPDENGGEEEIDLNEKTVAQLRELCSSIDLPSAEYKSLKKPELIAYIEEKIK